MLLEQGASVQELDESEYTPLFYAAAEGSIANLQLLLEKGSGDGRHVERKLKNVLYKARSYETVLLLCKYGADPRKLRNGDETALKYLVKKNNLESPAAFLDNQLAEIGDDMITMDFDILLEGDEKSKNHLDYHTHFRSHGRNDLILHPLMEVFLQLKWRQVQWLSLFEFIMRLAFVICLSVMAWRYMALTTCEYDRDDGANITGFVPQKGDVFRPKIMNAVYFDELNGTRLNDTHSEFSSPNDTKIAAITCKSDNLR